MKRRGRMRVVSVDDPSLVQRAGRWRWLHGDEELRVAWCFARFITL